MVCQPLGGSRDILAWISRLHLYCNSTVALAMVVSQQKISFPWHFVILFCFFFFLVAKSAAYFFKNGQWDVTSKEEKKRKRKSNRSSTALLADRTERETFDSFLQKTNKQKQTNKKKQKSVDGGKLWHRAPWDTTRSMSASSTLWSRPVPAIDLSCSACGRLYKTRTALVSAEPWESRPAGTGMNKTRPGKASGC